MYLIALCTIVEAVVRMNWYMLYEIGDQVKTFRTIETMIQATFEQMTFNVNS